MTDAVKIYHNPRCSKSRETLNLLKSNGIDPEVVLYLETPPDAQTIRQLLKMLNMGSARDLMRQKEDLYKSLNLNDTALPETPAAYALPAFSALFPGCKTHTVGSTALPPVHCSPAE